MNGIGYGINPLSRTSLTLEDARPMDQIGY
jgi:hypothetical protein